MRLAAADRSRYPKATRYLRYRLPYAARIPAIESELRKCTPLAQQAFAAALAWGSDPCIRIVVTSEVGRRLDPPAPNDVIEIGQQLVDDFEAGDVISQGSAPALAVAILRELVGWADGLHHHDRPDEEAEAFEILFQGRSIEC